MSDHNSYICNDSPTCTCFNCEAVRMPLRAEIYRINKENDALRREVIRLKGATNE